MWSIFTTGIAVTGTNAASGKSLDVINSSPATGSCYTLYRDLQQHTLRQFSHYLNSHWAPMYGRDDPSPLSLPAQAHVFQLYDTNYYSWPSTRQKRLDCTFLFLCGLFCRGGTPHFQLSFIRNSEFSSNRHLDLHHRPLQLPPVIIRSPTSACSTSTTRIFKFSYIRPFVLTPNHTARFKSNCQASPTTATCIARSIEQ